MIAVYTITRNRLDYTKQAFSSLERKAGHPYDHYIWDNGSTDGTYEWLKDHDYTVLHSEANVGQNVAANELLRTIREKGGYTHILRFDNDCFIESDNLLAELIEACGLLENKAVVSPRVEGLNWNPDRFATKDLGKHEAGFVDIIGGICRLHPTILIDGFWFDVRQPMGFGEASQVARWCQKKVIALAYIETLVVNHGVSTKEQIEKDPHYFKEHACLQRYPYVPPFA